MNSKVRALVWEECRTSGVIAASFAVVGAGLLLESRYSFGEQAWTREADFVGYGLFGVPLLTALLLVLNPNYAGHLEGGFSKYVLRLPVTTSSAVAAALITRTLSVLVVTAALVTISLRLFSEGPGYEVVYAFVLLYLGAQLLDWSRRPISGLSSVIALSVAALLFGQLLPNFPDLSPFKWISRAGSNASLLFPLAVFGFAVMVYLVGVVIVDADRVGRRWGFPEIWEWPGRISLASKKRGPFRSPVQAQVWFELRRSLGIFPIVMAVFIAGSLVFTWISASTKKNADDAAAIRLSYSTFAFFTGVFAAAIAQGLRSGASGWRNKSGKVGYVLLQPLTTAQFAQARVGAYLVLLVPTLALALAVHFATAGQLFVTQVFPEGLRLGATSARETAWIFLGRGLLGGIIAWVLFAIGTKIIQVSFAAAWGTAFSVAVFVSIKWIRDYTYSEQYKNAVVIGLMVLGLLYPIVLTLVLFWRARSQRLISKRSAMAWAAAWVLAAWLLRYVAIPAWTEEVVPLKDHLLSALNVVAFGSFVPLVYLATLFDIRRKRHSGAAPQDDAQHDFFAKASNKRLSVPGIILTAAIVLAAIWMGWPSKPAYLEYRKAKGYPATLRDLEVRYAEPPADENFATKYLSIVERRGALSHQYWTPIENEAAHRVNAPPPRQSILIAEGRELGRTESIATDVWTKTERYWEQVTSRVAPDLKEFVGHDTTNSRYPLHLRRPFWSESNYQLGGLGRELSLDSLHWAEAGESAKAMESIFAMFPLADSLKTEPKTYTQMQRMALLSDAAWAIQTLMNRCILQDADLARLQRVCESALPDLESMGRATIAESTVYFWEAHGTYSRAEYGDDRTPDALMPLVLATRLAYPLAALDLKISTEVEAALKANQLPWQELSAMSKRRDLQNEFVEPYFTYGGAASGWVYESVWNARLRLETARVGIALDRYRLAHGSLPRTLNDLVPAFLAKIPEDYYAEPGLPLRYVAKPDGEYVVSSVGKSFDRRSHPSESDRYHITFAVAPVSFRTGQHVAGD